MFLWNIAVTSLAEVWIEIVIMMKQQQIHLVTSLAEVWIEIMILMVQQGLTYGHFPCGSVD